MSLSETLRAITPHDNCSQGEFNRDCEALEQAAAILEAAEAWAKAELAYRADKHYETLEVILEAEKHLLAALAAHGPSQETPHDE